MIKSTEIIQKAKKKKKITNKYYIPRKIKFLKNNFVFSEIAEFYFESSTSCVADVGQDFHRLLEHHSEGVVGSITLKGRVVLTHHLQRIRLNDLQNK